MGNSVVVGECKCGGYGIVYDEHNEGMLGKCHEDGFKQYWRTSVAEMREYIPGELLDGISVSDQDDPPNDLGMIARNPNNHSDQWYVNRQYFDANFAPCLEADALIDKIESMGFRRGGGVGDLSSSLEWRQLREEIRRLKNESHVLEQIKLALDPPWGASYVEWAKKCREAAKE